MAEEPAKDTGGFWRTLPGIFAAAGTLIGAITGLVVALNQTGVFAKVLGSPNAGSTSGVRPTSGASIATSSSTPFFMTRRVVPADLAGKDLQELQLMRNEIYARHGRRFNRHDLQQYFERQSWYQGKYPPDAFPSDLLTPIQRENAILISEMENRGKP